MKAIAPKETLMRYDAGIELVLDGVDPWLVLESVLWPSEALARASAGELPPGWSWTAEGERLNALHERQRERYAAAKA